jgi:hypothetical protein
MAFKGLLGAARVLQGGSFTFKLDVFPQTKFQLREERPAGEQPATAE